VDVWKLTPNSGLWYR